MLFALFGTLLLRTDNIYWYKSQMKKIIIDKKINKELEKEQSFLDREDIKKYISLSNKHVLLIHKTEKADLIVTYLDSKSMSGETLCSLIRNDKELNKVSIIILCSNTKLHRQRCLKCQANTFLTYPINSAILLQEMHQLLNIAQRKSCRIPVKLKIEGNFRRKSIIAYTENISTSGMLINTKALLSEGDLILCNLSIPESRKISVEAEIVRTLEKKENEEMNYYGIKFTDISNEDADIIEKFLNKVH